MIRFIDIGTQTGPGEGYEDWPRQFSFFDATIDTFMVVGDSQIWDSWQSFVEDWKMEVRDRSRFKDLYPLSRFKKLCQNWVPGLDI